MKSGTSGTGGGRSEYNPKVQPRIEPRLQRNDTRKRNITISSISWWVSIGHKRNWNHNITTIRQPECIEVDGIGGGKRVYTLNEPERNDIATVRSPERRKASGIGGERQKEGTHQAYPKAQYHHGSAA